MKSRKSIRTPSFVGPGEEERKKTDWGRRLSKQDDDTGEERVETRLPWGEKGDARETLKL